MTTPPNPDSDWIRGWIEQQREQLQRAATDSAPGAWQLPGQVRDLGLRWLGVGEEMLNAWHAVWTGAKSAGEGATERFSDLLGRAPPLGLAREQTEAWRELTNAQKECQKLEQELRVVLMRVQTDALAMLEERVRERQRENKPISSYRELYDLWVECGERVYSPVAHSDAYSKLQAQLTNATMRLRARQQSVIEWTLKQFDLPTRSELNTLHRQMRELRDKVTALEAQLAAQDRSRK